MLRLQFCNYAITATKIARDQARRSRSILHLQSLSCLPLRFRHFCVVKALKDEPDGRSSGFAGQSWDPGLENEVPFEQRPVNEYSSLKNSILYSWGELSPGSFFLRLGGLCLVTFTVLGGPIAAASFSPSKDPLRFALAAGTGTLLLVSLVVLRIYLGWSYVGDRLLSAVIPYEETGWYDGQMWVKPPEVLARDRLLGSYKDPFFYAAEEVQESADRMESVYRQWMIHEKRPAGGVKDLSAAELRRELHTALGTAKWQLEELERAVRSSDHALSSGEATVTRHNDFIEAISSKISMVEKALKELNVEDRRSALEWVRLDEVERDELALFLSYPKSEVEKVLPTSSGDFLEPEHSMNGLNTLEMNEGKMKDHQCVASACADLGEWKTSVSTERSPHKLLDEQPPPRIFNLSQFRTVEAITKPKWYRNGFRKCKTLSNEDMKETIPLHNNQLSRDMDACYAKSKSCLSDCTDESYNKQLYGWLGGFQRQIQRSQYHIQYRRPIQMIIWTIVTVFLIGTMKTGCIQLSK